MCYRARVTLQGDPNGVHARPAAWVAWKLRGLEADVQFQQNGAVVDVRPAVAMVDIMQAAVDLDLANGSTFEVICRGPQAREAFQALREGFTTSYFEGTVFVPLETPGEADDA